MMKPPVWTWEVPLYFWFGGIAAGLVVRGAGLRPRGRPPSARRGARASRSARSLPSPAAAVLDLGRPERFHNMLRIFKPRSPMSMGAWALTAFGTADGGAVGGRPARPRPRGARALGARQRAASAATSAPTPASCWPRPRCRCGRARACSSGRSSSAPARPPAPSATRLVARRGRAAARPPDARRRSAASRAGAMATELVARRRSTSAASGGWPRACEQGRPGGSFKAAQVARPRRPGTLRCARPLARGRAGAPCRQRVLPRPPALCFRYAWVGAGRRPRATTRPWPAWPAPAADAASRTPDPGPTEATGPG